MNIRNFASQGLKFVDRGRLQKTIKTRRYEMCYALRDIFGNPFWPVRFSPEWRTNIALALAEQIYAARDFSAMPVLVDALQDTGCDNDDILNHCRRGLTRAGVG